MSHSQKRSKHINLHKMRKAFSLKPLAIGVAIVFLSACGEDGDASKIYVSVDDCQKENPDAVSQCQAAFESAIEEHNRTAPRFNSQNDCEYEFGSDRCQYVQSQSGSFFMPFMAGFIVSRLLQPSPYYSQPLYTSFSPYSPFRSRWVTSNGYVFDGDIRRRSYYAPSSVYKPKPAVNRTINRGGFGSTVRAKSSWGSSGKSSGWGG
ncbi:DUF1190 domain-containing protein [Aestuariibacter sp. GS-14]|uniref:DUF1190 domain-containing protein n=1 Tax=Aestuariibacter sp. GS-14 TaxID=2590670 RepID=UPI001125DD11|nr:DUF1190 domain-containing protein [Aestuariibacter sp. GS-14]TPV62081.1 DUF1190 domain-containing protein [Aestuariibacter sp. GS-14]